MKANRFIISALVSSALISFGATAVDGTINFSGSVTAAACETILGAVQDGNCIEFIVVYCCLSYIFVKALIVCALFSCQKNHEKI
ncbi:hypothetical protein [Klebsiella oxytoca]|uniref:hypothetical protein n=1 Tax=Klebsiella oxytoca TaxID=571 RepID=UPI0029303A7D|nr:hypothetical protein [Klebsiella oxytoca]